MASVEFKNASKIFDDGTRALSDLSLSICAGEILVCVGPSGCGKSTMLRLIAGLERLTEGDILIDGAVVNDLAPQARNVAMVFQNYALYPHMSVRRNLEFPLRMMKTPRRQVDARVAEVANLLGLHDLLLRKPKDLSGGQRQRVAMGRAIVRKPKVFLMDEPLSNLDARLRIKIRADIAQLQRRTGTTTVYVTHDQVEAMTLGDRVALIHEGRLQQVATPQEVYDRPANVFVAQFVGSPGMNIFDGVLGAGDRGLELHVENHRFLLPAGCRRLESYSGKPVRAGLRPENFSYLSDGDKYVAAAVTAEAIEPLGHEHLLHFKMGTVPMIARLPGYGQLKPGQEAVLYVDPRKLHFFDTDARAIY